MLKNINTTLLLNKKNFSHIPGKRFRYSPQITWLTAIVLFAIITTFTVLTIIDSGLLPYGIFILIIFSYQLLSMFHKLIFKNPIFILNNNKLFYTKVIKSLSYFTFSKIIPFFIFSIKQLIIV